jgi:uncharacterized membrane protein (DUF373 family)
MGGPEKTDAHGAKHTEAPAGRPVWDWPLVQLRTLLHLSEDLAHYAVAILLLTLAVIVLYHTAVALVEAGSTFSARVISGIDGVLFVIIVIELMQTVMAHFEHTGFQLKPFLIIGIISAVRHILTIGARLTLAGDVTGAPFRQSQIELGVETAVVLGLVVGLLLVRIGDRMGGNEFEGD